nr:putative acid phosphatase, class B-like protein [Tanacetum cinerariifolium]
MSAYGHPMEREYSARSVSSAEGSDMGSQFRMESVIYMSSCAATVFIGALVVVGILLMTLLMSLTVMLQSCQSRQAGVLESAKADHHKYDYCKMAAVNAELNSFEANSLPEFCKDVAVKYIKEGHYMRELNNSVSLVENYFSGIRPDNDGRDVVLMDIDDLLSTNTLRTNPLLYGNGASRKMLMVGGPPEGAAWASRKPEKQRNATTEDLTSAGCHGWSKLILRSTEEMKLDTREYFSKQKTAIQAESYHIRAVISSHMDALVGTFIRTQNFKLPNPLPVAPPRSII